MKEIISKYLKDHGFGEFNPKAVLFDMDGVLYNSMPNHAVAWQESMKQFDIHMTAADAYATEGELTDAELKLLATLGPDQARIVRSVATRLGNA